MGTTNVAWRRRGVSGVVLAFGAITIGEWELGTTVAIHAYAVGGAVLVGLVGMRFLLASIASLFTHHLVVQVRRERILTVVALARVASGVGITVALWRHLPFIVPVVLVWVDAAIGSAYRPAQAALLPALVNTPGELTAASSLTSNAKSVGQMLGALLGSLAIDSVSVTMAVAAAPVLYFVAAACTVAIRSPKVTRSPAAQAHGHGELSKLGEGARALFADREATELTILTAIRALVRGLWLALGVVAAETILGLGQAGFGWLMAAAMGGAGLSVLLTSHLAGTRALVPWFAAGLLLCGVPVSVVGLTHTGAVAIGLMVVWGFGMSLADAVGLALTYRVVRGSEISVATGAEESGALFFTGAGSILAPAILALWDLRGALVVTGLLVPLVMFALITVVRPSFLPRITAIAQRRLEVLGRLARVPLFAPLRLESIEAVAAQLTPVSAAAGTDVIVHRQHDDQAWYLVQEGELGILIDGYDVQRIGPGATFGELALLRDGPRTATVRAFTPVSLLRLERRAFLEAVSGGELDPTDLVDSAADSDDPREVLRHPALLRGLGRHQLHDLVHAAVQHHYGQGERIISAGDHDDRYFVVISGRALAQGVDWIQDLLPGDGFGEIAVLHRVARTVDVRAAEPTRLLAVPGAALHAALGLVDGAEPADGVA